MFINDVNDGTKYDKLVVVRDGNEYKQFNFAGHTLDSFLSQQHIGQVVEVEARFSNPAMEAPPRQVFAANLGKEIDDLYARSHTLKGKIGNLETAVNIVGSNFNQDAWGSIIKWEKEPVDIYVLTSSASNPQFLLDTTSNEAKEKNELTGITYKLREISSMEQWPAKGILVEVTRDVAVGGTSLIVGDRKVYAAVIYVHPDYIPVVGHELDHALLLITNHPEWLNDEQKKANYGREMRKLPFHSFINTNDGTYEVNQELLTTFGMGTNNSENKILYMNKPIPQNVPYIKPNSKFLQLAPDVLLLYYNNMGKEMPLN